MDKLTPTLTEVQLKNNIDSLHKQGKDTPFIQSYVNNYQKGSNGSFSLKNQPTQNIQSGNQPSTQPDTATTQPDLLHKPTVPFGQSEGGKIINAAGQSISDTNQDIASGKIGMQEGMLQHAGSVAKAGGELIGQTLKDVTPQPVKDFIKTQISHVIQGTNAQPRIDQAVKAYSEMAAAHPRAAKDFESLLNVGALLPVGEGAGIVKKVGEEGVGLAERGVAGVKDVVGAAKDTLESGTKKMTEEVINKMAGKPLEEIKNTPAEEVWNLKPKDRATWRLIQEEQDKNSFSQEKELMGQSHANEISKMDNASKQEIDAMKEKHLQEQNQLQQKYDIKKSDTKNQFIKNEQHIEEHLQGKTSELLKEQNDLESQLKQTSRKNAIAARQPLINTLRDSGQHYLDLVDEEMGTKGTMKVITGDLSDSIDRYFSEDIPRASEIKNRLGITNKTDLTSETTIDNIYKKAKELRQDIGGAAKSGSRVYTADEKLTEDAVSSLTRYMKDKGVDLAAANRYWSEWAPIRNKAINNFRPFDVNEIAANKGAVTLENVVLGTDQDAVSLVKNLEERMGQSMTKDLQSIIQKMTTNQRKKFAEEYNAQSAREIASMAKEQESQFSSIQQEVDQKKLGGQQFNEKTKLENQQKYNQKNLEEKHLADQKDLEVKKQAIKEKRFIQNHEIEHQAAKRNIIKNALKNALKAIGLGSGVDVITHL